MSHEQGESPEIPKKALVQIFASLNPTERQGKRGVCTAWDKVIVDEFPVEIKINNNNFEHLLQCPNARKATVHSLTFEYIGNIGFKNTLKGLVISGKALSSNIVQVLKECKELETLEITNLKDILRIDNHEVFAIPKLKTIEIKVRMDQETFTSDEINFLNVLCTAKLPALEKVLVTATFDWDEEEEDRDEDESTSQGFSLEFNDSSLQEENSSFRVEGVGLHSLETESFSPMQQPSSSYAANTRGSDNETMLDLEELIDLAPPVEPSQGSHSQVIAQAPNRPSLVDASAGSSDNSSRTTATTRIGVAEYEFLSRLLAARLRMWSNNSHVDLDSYLNDASNDRGRYYGFGIFTSLLGAGTGASEGPNATHFQISNTPLFTFLKNNGTKLKSFIVKARSDFICFGNITTFPKEAIGKIQMEDVDYSFGRSKRLCSEYLLLEQQSHLTSLKMNILDDLWPSIMTAVDKSRATMTELDVKIFSLNEDPIDLIALSRCSNLKTLKLFHFFEKHNIQLLPPSLTKLVMNGPITKEDLNMLASRLQNLVQFDLILNHNPNEKIDLPLFQKLVSMPNIRKLVFIQSQIDVGAASNYCETTPGLTITVQGPRELKEPYTLTLASAIQYVAVSIDHQVSPTIRTPQDPQL